MHIVGRDVIQDALIVRYQHDGAVIGAELIYAVGHDTQGVDVQAGVRLVEQRQRRFEQGELQYLIALFLAAGKAFVHRAPH